MTPCQLAQQWWKQHNPQDFGDVLTAHLLGGYVVSTPEHFIMFHDMHWDGREARTDMEPNGYFVTMAASCAGNAVAALMRLCPSKRDYVAWVRRSGSDMRVYNWDKLTRKVGI
jgi:hypothetical protein